MSETVAHDLKSLHTAAIDARHGYEEALKDAEGHGMTPLFQEMIALHNRNGEELGAALRAAGEPVDDDGSFMSAVHRTVIGIRSLFGGLGESVLPGLIDGEKRNVSHYDDALGDAALPEGTRDLLIQQRGRIETAILGMQAAKI